MPELGGRHWSDDETHTLGVRLGSFFSLVRSNFHLSRYPRRSDRPENQQHARARGFVDIALAWSHIRRASGVSGRLTVQQSKTDQTDAGKVLWVNPDSMTVIVTLAALIYQVQTLTTQLDELTARV